MQRRRVRFLEPGVHAGAADGEVPAGEPGRGRAEAEGAEAATVLIVEPGAFRTQLFGPGFRAMPVMSEYAETVGPTRKSRPISDGKAQGNPAKAARAIADAVDAGTPTLRLPLGPDAVEWIRKKLAGVLAEVEHTEAVARATGF
jgi:hypothetical protein